jgi:hypothetical protein
MAYVAWMEPVNSPYGPLPASTWGPPGGMPWSAPPPPDERPVASRPLPAQARPGLVVLAALLTEVVLIAALANQAVSDRLAKHFGDATPSHLLEQAWLTYQWRFSARSHQSATWGSELALIGVTLLVSALLIIALVRGAVTFWRAFFGVWLAVLGATLLGAFVRGLIDTDAARAIGASSPGRLTKAIFGPAGPTQFAVVGGVVLGLVTALVAAGVSVATRRAAQPVPGAPAVQSHYVAPEQPPPYYGDAQPTTQLRPPPQPRAGDQATTQFPRPPDEEDLH